MKNIGIALISAGLVLALGGCGSDKYDYNKIADAIKAKGGACHHIKINMLGSEVPYVEDIRKMNRSEYDKLMKTMGCDLNEYSIKAQLEKAKEEVANNDSLYGTYEYERAIEHIEKMGK